MKGKLPKETLFLWQARMTLIALLPIIILCIFSLLTKWILIGLAAWVVIAAVFILWYLPCYLKSYEILFPKGAIVINHGVFIKTTHIMPFSRLVYAQSISSPLAERLGLAALTLKAARSSILIPELKAEDVNLFLNYLSEEDKE